MDQLNETEVLKKLEEARRSLAELRAEAVIDRPHEAAKVGIIGLHLGTLQRWSQAETTLREALAIGEQFGTPLMHQWHQLLAGALTNQGQNSEALEQYRLALDFAQQNREEDESAISRYFLAGHLQQMQRYEEALTLIPEESVHGQAPHIYCLRAFCLRGLNRRIEACSEATNAIAACANDEQRTDFQEQLADLL